LSRSSLQAYFLVGPTASGKSRVAHWIAEQENYDILCADSMSIYKGMDIGTSKPSPAERQRVSYSGIDLATPDQTFSVWQYRMDALQALRQSILHGHTVAAVGGTGLYVKALTSGLADAAAPHLALRVKWAALLAGGGVEALAAELKRCRPDLYDQLQDKQNPRRLIRALEKAHAGTAETSPTWGSVEPSAPLVGLRLEPELLKSKIEQRVYEMYRQGFLDEVRALLERYGKLAATASKAIGYAEAIDCLAGRCSEEDAIAATTVRTRRLAKRQRTWFQHQADVKWVDVCVDSTVEEVAGHVMDTWQTLGATCVIDRETNGQG